MDIRVRSREKTGPVCNHHVNLDCAVPSQKQHIQSSEEKKKNMRLQRGVKVVTLWSFEKTLGEIQREPQAACVASAHVSQGQRQPLGCRQLRNSPGKGIGHHPHDAMSPLRWKTQAGTRRIVPDRQGESRMRRDKGAAWAATWTPKEKEVKTTQDEEYGRNVCAPTPTPQFHMMNPQLPI